MNEIKISSLPTTAVLEMTYRCNHRCLFCSVPWEAEKSGYEIRKELDIAGWKKCIDILVEQGINDFAFTGGEPLLRKDIFEIIEYVASKEIDHFDKIEDLIVKVNKRSELHLISNGTLVNRQILEFCKKYSINLSMSLPGLDTYYEHTQYGNPDEILEKFKIAKEIGVSVNVNIATTKKNLHELYETISMALISGAESLLINRFLPGGRGLVNSKELMLSRAEVNQMLQTSEEVLKTANRFGHVGTELPLCIVDDYNYEFLEIGSTCAGGVDFFAVDPSGYIRPCNHSPRRLFHFTEIEKVQDNEYWRKFSDKDYIPNGCGGCKLIEKCDGGCREAAHIVRDDLHGIDPVFSSEKEMMSCCSSVNI